MLHVDKCRRVIQDRCIIKGGQICGQAGPCMSGAMSCMSAHLMLDGMESRGKGINDEGGSDMNDRVEEEAMSVFI